MLASIGAIALLRMILVVSTATSAARCIRGTPLHWKNVRQRARRSHGEINVLPKLLDTKPTIELNTKFNFSARTFRFQRNLPGPKLKHCEISTLSLV